MVTTRSGSKDAPATDQISTSKPKPKAIIFDLLTALLDSWTLWDSCAGSPTLGRQWRTQYLKLTFSRGTYHAYTDMVAMAAAEMATSGIPNNAAIELERRWQELTPWPEVKSVLGKLRAEGYKVGVITNCSTELGRKAAARCEFEFDEVLTAEQVGFYKPHPRAYAAIVEALGCEAHECLFVAGSAGDVVGASEARMRVVWHNHVGLEPQPDKDGKVVTPEGQGRELEGVLRGVGVI